MKSTLTYIIVFLFSFNGLFGQQTLEETILYDGNDREYTIYIPAGYDGNTALPLLFNFHGGSGDIASQIAISDMRWMADEQSFILVYPQAIGDPNDGGSTNWTHKEPTEVDDIFFVEAMIEVIVNEYAIDESRVYACGYSNGGEFTFELACRLSDRIAAIGVVARSMYIETFNNCEPNSPKAVLSIHGTDDDYEGISWQGVTYYVSLDEVNDFWANNNNANTSPVVTLVPNTNTNDGSTVEHYVWGNGDECVSVEHLKVINGGHDWPGTFGNMDISADVEIWNFVSKYNLSGLIDCASTSVEEGLENTNIQVFPNPVSDYVVVELNGLANLIYQLYSTDGKLIQSGILDSNNGRIELSKLPPSVYFLKVGNQLAKLVKTK